MNKALATNNTNIISYVSFDMSVLGYQGIRDAYERGVILDELRMDIGNDLFCALSDKDKQFILDTEGTIDFGYKAGEDDLKRISSSIKNDYQY